MKNYDHKKIEKKWQNEWEKKKLYEVKNTAKGKKFYGLIEFPYPSGAGLHVGHIRSNTAMDIITRKRRMEGYNVLYPIGWDAFGLPTENYAIKTGIQPEKVTKINTDIFRKQLKSVGFGFDWSREINTTDPAYYKWTQWIFLQMYKKGLAYKSRATINWCPKDKIGLANEEVVGGLCDRCGTKVIKKEKEQWMLAITKYADRLDKDLDDVNYLEKIKIQQRNWIGKSEGSEIEFQIIAGRNFSSGPRTREDEGPDQLRKVSTSSIKVFTTRADTLFGATYVVLAPEHELVKKLSENISNKKEVEDYIKEVRNKLNQYGIKFILVSKLEQTPIDGYTFWSENNPSIALTLRHRRIDNFAFTIMHEIGHIDLHIKKDRKKYFFDLQKEKPLVMQFEEDANEYAKDKLIPEKIWEEINITIDGDRFAQKLLRMHLYHLMVSASEYNVDIDAGITARGLHGEGGDFPFDHRRILRLGGNGGSNSRSWRGSYLSAAPSSTTQHQPENKRQ